MNIFLTSKTALVSLKHHKARAFLTMLGIIIGTAGIIVTLSLGDGAAQKARDQILSMGSDCIHFQIGNWASKNISKDPKPFTEEDVNLLKELNPNINEITPVIRRHMIPIEYQGKQFNANVSGFYPCGFEISDDHIDKGTLFTQYHILYKNNVVVIDHKSVEALFPWEDPLGKTIRIDSIPFTIIGVLAKPKIEGRWDWVDRLSMYVPFSTAKATFMKHGWELDSFEFTSKDSSQNPRMLRQMIRTLRAQHGLKEDEPNDFMYYDIQEMAKAAESSAKIIGLFAALAASIAMLVGGIGIMNIMLVAVKERTQEIGIKLALGATRSIIQTQFLVESVALSIAGGLLGIVAGVCIAYLVEYYFQLPASISFLFILLAFLVTFLIGLCFGYFPARQASRLNVVDAINEP